MDTLTVEFSVDDADKLRERFHEMWDRKGWGAQPKPLSNRLMAAEIILHDQEIDYWDEAGLTIHNWE